MIEIKLPTLILFCLIFFAGSLPAETLPAIVNNVKSEKLALELEQAKKEIVEKEVQQRKIMSSLYEINRKMKKIITEQSNLTQERMVSESSARELARKVLDLEEKLKLQKALMRERLSAIYKLGGQGLARIIFSSSSSADLEKNLKILGIIAKHDLDIIKEYAATMKELEFKKIKFTQRLARIKKLSEQIKNQEAKLAAENNGKSKILSDIRKSKQFSLNRLSGLRSKTNQLISQDESGVLDLLFRPSFFEKKSTLPPPVSGRVAKGFGVVHDEEHNLSWSHKGLLYVTSKDSPVRSVFEGTVAFVGHVSGHGKTIILDHGDHYYSVYGNIRDVQVHVGDEVRQSQIMALTGHNQKMDGFDEDQISDGIYFEIRHFSEPNDPQSWLKGNI